MKITTEMLNTLVSGDYYGVSMAEVLAAMEDCWEHVDSARARGERPLMMKHPSEVPHGSPLNYIVYLAESMLAHGWKDDGDFWGRVQVYGNTVRDGHHRILAAYLADVDVPDITPEMLTYA